MGWACHIKSFYRIYYNYTAAAVGTLTMTKLQTTTAAATMTEVDSTTAAAVQGE